MVDFFLCGSKHAENNASGRKYHILNRFGPEAGVFESLGHLGFATQ